VKIQRLGGGKVGGRCWDSRILGYWDTGILRYWDIEILGFGVTNITVTQV